MSTACITHLTTAEQLPTCARRSATQLRVLTDETDEVLSDSLEVFFRSVILNWTFSRVRGQYCIEVDF